MPRYPVPAATADAPHCSETVVRRSRFLAQAARAASPAEARAVVELCLINISEPTRRS